MARLGRGYVLIDENPEAIQVATRGLASIEGAVAATEIVGGSRDPVEALF